MTKEQAIALDNFGFLPQSFIELTLGNEDIEARADADFNTSLRYLLLM